MFVKDTVANTVRKQLESGSIRFGEKMPSVRKLSHEFNVSISTALEVYRYLESIGYISAKERSGYFAAYTSPDSTSYSNKLYKAVAGKIRTKDLILEVFLSSNEPDHVSFGVGAPHPGIMPYKRVNRKLNQLIKANSDIVAKYTLPPGYKKARQAIAKWVKPFCGVVDAEDVLLTEGCLEAIHLALNIYTKPGDYVAVESPAYFGILQTIGNSHLKAIEIPTCPTGGMEPEALLKATKEYDIKAIILTCHAQNPLGFIMSEKDKLKILEICSKKNIQIIEDDIYGDMVFSSKRELALKAFDKDGIVTYCASFSKTVAPGLRLGWCIPPQNKMPDFVEHKITLNVASNSIGQHILPEILDPQDMKKIISEQKAYYKKQVEIYTNYLQSSIQAEFEITKPQGSYFLWCKVKGLDSVNLFHQCLEKKVSISPGPIFSASGAFKDCFRLNCSLPFDTKTEKALKVVCDLINNMVVPTKRGV